MTHVLYGNPGSGSATTELALAHLQLPVEVRDVSLDENAQRASDYAAINAQRKLPALITPEGETLTESAAILVTLAERYPDGELLPRDARLRGQALRWLLFMSSEIYPVIEGIDYPERFQPEEEATPEQRRNDLRKHLRKILKDRWLLVEQAAAGKPWFLPGEFSAVDIYAAVLSRWGLDRAWRDKHLPRIESLAGELAGRDGLAAVWQRHFG